MKTIIVPLGHILLDPSSPVDLGKLPEDDAIRLIKESYGFLSSAVTVRIEGDSVIITLDQPKAAEVQEALKLFERAVKSVKHGDYPKAISQFSRVLTVLPTHVDARRNLAMAKMERGEPEIAKGLLRECLRIDPKDAWSYVLLGNIAARNDNNLEAAAFYFECGLAINPAEDILLNNFAALRMQQGRYPEAKVLFQKALESNPLYPNTYFGLALLQRVLGDLEEVTHLLEKLSLLPKSADPRTAPVYRNASGLYAEIAQELATKDGERLLGQVIARKKALEVATGHPIEITEDESLEYVSAVAQMAWKHGREEHRVRYRRRSPAITPHLLAHELEHILLEHEARRCGNNRTFISTSANRERAIQSVAGHIIKLQRQGYPEEDIGKMMNQLIQGMTSQVFNCPLDMVVEHNLRLKYPELRFSQLVSLHRLNADSLKTYCSPEIRRLTPPRIFRDSVTLNCAFAIFIDHLFPAAPSCAEAYRSFEHFATAHELYDLWEAQSRSFTPGEEYQLVEAFAARLKLSDWFEWRHDEQTHAPPHSSSPTGNVQVAAEDQSEVFTFCLDALRRFEGKSRDEVSAVSSEIGLLGTRGIDHTSPEKKYSLVSYPGEKFSGLHLLCLMYVGFKIYDPALNTELDFSAPYALALEAHRAVKH